MMKLSFYGHFSGWSSYPTVCKAIAWYLEDKGLDFEIGDLRPQRLYDAVEELPRVDDEILDDMTWAADGHELLPADRRGISLLFGFPEWARVIPQHEFRIGYHVCDGAKLPKHWVEIMNTEDHVFTPSAWCASVFRKEGVRVPISVVPHGVSPAFQPTNYWSPDNPIHHYSSGPLRKGSEKLVGAFGRGVKGLGNRSVMVVTDKTELFRGSFSFAFAPRGELSPPVQARRVRATSLLIAPSRAEGFGMIPLEHLCAGVPVVTTNFTGHTEWLGEMGSMTGHPGVALILGREGLHPMGNNLAPDFATAELQEKIEYALAHLGILREEAMDNALGLFDRWNWMSALDNSPFLETIQRA